MNSDTDKTYEFFAVVPPGLEQLAKSELIDKTHLVSQNQIEVAKTHGGLLFSLPALEAYSLNRHLKIPTRILQRMASFKCRDFPKLFQKSRKINWNEFIISSEIEIKASSKKSRLIHTKKIENALRDGFIKYRQGNPIKEKHRIQADRFPTPTIFINIYEDVCTISLDTTGERLNIRQERKLISKAPIRENLASALIYKLSQFFSSSCQIVDPMAGSGVFAIEGLNFNKENQREFTFECFRNILFPTNSQNSEELSHEPHDSLPLFQNYLLNEKDENVFQALKQNLNNKEKVEFQLGDFHKLQLQNENVIICNLPYGERIKVDNLKSFYEDFCKWITQQETVTGAGLLFPSNWLSLFQQCLKSMQEVDLLKFKNGGIDVCFLIVKREGPARDKPSS